MTKLPIENGESRYYLVAGEESRLGSDSGTLPRQLAVEVIGVNVENPLRIRQLLLDRDRFADVVVLTRTDLGVGVSGESGALSLPDTRVKNDARLKTLERLRQHYDEETFTLVNV